MLKIENLKKGDKIYCIKTYIDTKRKSPNQQEINKCSTPLERAKYISYTIDQEEPYDKFIKNKTYNITSKLGHEITVKAELGEMMFGINKNNTDKNYQTETFLNEYFISLSKFRKLKLQLLSDNNFNSFLKKIKK